LNDFLDAFATLQIREDKGPLAAPCLGIARHHLQARADLQSQINDIAESVWDLRPGGKLNPSVGAELLTSPNKEAVLRKNGLPATADLLNQARKLK
jgi:hypothetical protein